ncbi:MAG: TetR/AcrR family transcriptional regulator [Gammaproteobacteria bacterium]|nr:TetR/AcrR family transcriptional regulator [Gammaproteobacteria bacterium]
MPAVVTTENNKRTAILDIASDLFLAKGYAGASINEMYRRTGISKETFYRYFKDKEMLFLAVIDKELESYWQGLAILDEVQKEQDTRETLTRVGGDLIFYLSSKRVRLLRQLIFNECENHPLIGQLYYDHGPERAYRAFTAYFDHQKDKGLNWRFDSNTLAESFVALLLHKITLQQSCRIEDTASESSSHLLAGKIVDHFLNAYMLE